MTADGWYAKQKYLDAVVAAGLHVVTKLRSDANMRFRYTGQRTGKQGRPKTYDGKVDWQALSRFDKVEAAELAADEGVEIYTAELYHATLQRWLRTVVLVWHTADGKQFAGLTESQARDEAALDFHFNAALATVSATRAALVQEQANEEPFVFSLATQKQLAFNERFLAAISAKYGYDLKDWKNHPAYEELRTYGALAA